MSQLKPLCTLADLEATGAKTLIHEGRDICIVQHGADFYGYINACPHLGLSLNYVDDRVLTPNKQQLHCINHDAYFEIHTGLCTAGPCLGQKLQPFVIRREGDVIVVAE